jgi:hypothetical protein
MLELLISDLTKQKRSKLLVIVIAIPIVVSMLLAVDFSIRYESYLYPLAVQKGIDSWAMLLKEQNMVFFKQYLPLFGAMIIGSIFDNEYKNNGWTLTLTYPIARKKIVISKYISSLIYMCLMLLINVAALICVGKFMKFPEAINIMYFVKMFLLQFIFTAAVMTIHLYLSLRNKNSMISIGIAAIICVVSSNMFFNGSSISKFNPYSFTSFADGGTPVNMGILIVMAIVLCIGGLVYTVKYLNRKESY